MTPRDIFTLFLLAAIWGGSFLFMKMAVPVFGAGMLIELRVLSAAIFLLVIGFWVRRALNVRENWRYFAFMGLINSAVPFFLFAYAAQNIGASTMSVLNSTSPLFGAAVGMVWLRTKITPSIITGLSLGVFGVYILVGKGITIEGDEQWLAVAATLLASFCYGLSSNYAKVARANIDPFANAHGSMWAASLFFLPALFLAPPTTTPLAADWAAILTLGVVCTGFAYILYFKLIRDAGPMNALSVTFVIPAFGIFWGWLLLDEQITAATLIGCAVVLMGLALTNGIIRLPKRSA